MAAPKDGPAPARRRGRPPRIDRQMIVEAARDLDPEQLTMQVIADRLGVHRNAVHYHVADREGLLRLLAADTVARAAGQYSFDDDEPWQTTVRTFAVWAKDSYLAAGKLIDYYRFEPSDDLSSLVPVDHFLRSLRRSGFDENSAARALTMALTVALGFARDVILSEPLERHPQLVDLAAAIDVDTTRDFAALRRLVEHEHEPSDTAQFDFDLDLMVLGLEAWRDRSAGGRGR